MWVPMHRHGPLTFFGPAKGGQGHPAPLSVCALWVVESHPKPCSKYICSTYFCVVIAYSIGCSGEPAGPGTSC